jgi:hypothetical protein
MDKRKYFKNLVKLFEASRTDIGEPGAQGQAFVADSGADVAGTAADQPEQVTKVQPGVAGIGATEEAPGQALGDADYLSAVGAGVPGLPANGDSKEVPEPKKKAKLFELFRDLLNYSNVFVESLTNIDMNLLDMDQIDKIKRNTDHVDDVIGKVRSYVIDTFPTERYEKALYVYILLRTELVTIIRLLRESLGLSHDPEAPKTIETAEETAGKP